MGDLYHDSFNQNDVEPNRIGSLMAIQQRNQQIARQQESAAAVRVQTAALEKQNRSEPNRSKAKQQEVKVEQGRLRAEEMDREIRLEQAELLKQLRSLMADSCFLLERLEDSRPAH